PLADDRREEIFVAKATLREKYAALDEPQRALFAPLGLDAAEARQSPTAKDNKPPAARAELAPSVPPVAFSTSRPPPDGESLPGRLPAPPPPPRATSMAKSALLQALKPAKPPPPPPSSQSSPNSASQGNSSPKRAAEPTNPELAASLRKIFNI